MTVELKSSRNYPGRIDLSHRHSPESNSTTTLALTWEDLEELLQSAQQVLGTRPEPPRRIDIAQDTYAVGTRTILNLVNEALCANNTVSVYIFENRKG